jgi:hemolysin III
MARDATVPARKVGEIAESVRPKLRGWLHVGAFPAALIAGLVLVTLGPTLTARLAAAVYALTSVLLFGVSALYHRGQWSERAVTWLRRFDHANIYLVIAGTYTPISMLALQGNLRVVVLAVIWTGAAAGVAFRVLWSRAPRWLYTALYIGLGWVAAGFLPQLLDGAGVAALVLVCVGGLLYSAGGLVYGLRRPDPSPRWFGFHEVFHAFTIAAYVAQYIAISFVVYRAL